MANLNFPATIGGIGTGGQFWNVVKKRRKRWPDFVYIYCVYLGETFQG